MRVSTAAASLLLATHTAHACSCVADTLGERFRDAKAVFVGRAVAEEPKDASLVQNRRGDDRHAQTVQVVRGFKGVGRKFIRVTFDVESLKKGHMCPTLIHFEPSREYLVFAYGKHYEVRTVCSDTWEIPADREAFGYDSMQHSLKQLGSFWFRLRARLNPF